MEIEKPQIVAARAYANWNDAFDDDAAAQKAEAIRAAVLDLLNECMDDDIFVVPTSIEKVVFSAVFNADDENDVESTATNGNNNGTTNGGGSTNTDGTGAGTGTTTGNGHTGMVSSNGSTNNNGSAWNVADNPLILAGGAVFLLLLFCCCCIFCCCCRKRRRRHTKTAREQHQDRQVASVWDSHSDEELAREHGNSSTALAVLDSLALAPQHGNFLKISAEQDDNASLNTTSGTSAASSSPNRSHKNRSRTSSLAEEDLLHGQDDVDTFPEDDSLFEFIDPSFSANSVLLRRPSDTTATQCSSRSCHTTADGSFQRGRSSPATTASRSTILHGNFSAPPRQLLLPPRHPPPQSIESFPPPPPPAAAAASSAVPKSVRHWSRKTNHLLYPPEPRIPATVSDLHILQRDARGSATGHAPSFLSSSSGSEAAASPKLDPQRAANSFLISNKNNNGYNVSGGGGSAAAVVITAAALPHSPRSSDVYGAPVVHNRATSFMSSSSGGSSEPPQRLVSQRDAAYSPYSYDEEIMGLTEGISSLTSVASGVARLTRDDSNVSARRSLQMT